MSVRVQERLIWFHLTSAFPFHWSQIDKTTRKQSCKRRCYAFLRPMRSWGQEHWEQIKIILKTLSFIKVGQNYDYLDNLKSSPSSRNFSQLPAQHGRDRGGRHWAAEGWIVGTQLALYLLEERMATGVNAVHFLHRDNQHQFVGEPINPIMQRAWEQLFSSYDLPFQLL